MLLIERIKEIVQIRKCQAEFCSSVAPVRSPTPPQINYNYACDVELTNLHGLHVTRHHKDAVSLTLNQLTTTIVAPPSNADKLQMGFNSAFKGMHEKPTNTPIIHSVY